MKKTIVVAAGILASNCIFAAGFGLYEATARGNALGGALVGSTGDASANYFNPANLTESTNVSVVAGLTFINPFCDVYVDGRPQTKMNPGWFVAPTFYASVPLPFDMAFGWGNYSEFGLGTKYGRHWDLAGDTLETTMKQYTFNPNLAWKPLDWWSVAAGIRMSYIQFENFKEPHHGESFYYDAYGITLPQYSNAYHLKSHLKGDSWDWGYSLSTSFRILTNLTAGVVYRSRIRHNIKGDFNLRGGVDTPLGRVSQHEDLHAGAKLTLPQSVTFGANWDATEKLRFGAAVTWTEWSSVETIRFRIPKYGYSEHLKWEDAWRFGFGCEYDLLDWLSPRISYVYDRDPCNNGTTMLPAGDRHIIGTGLGFKITESLRFDLGYSLVMMEDSDRRVSLTTMSGETETHKFSARNSFSHLVSATVSYSF
ncbi:MAG: outer membrane protein transport protein [Kiritimatiellae bacterium]|nr:outer membrane protein transport protein [Kiritimatiellia bacterium]